MILLTFRARRVFLSVDVFTSVMLILPINGNKFYCQFFPEILGKNATQIILLANQQIGKMYKALSTILDRTRVETKNLILDEKFNKF